MGSQLMILKSYTNNRESEVCGEDCWSSLKIKNINLYVRVIKRIPIKFGICAMVFF